MTAKSFKKGDKVWLVMLYGYSMDLTRFTFKAFPLQITSWGKKQATAIKLDTHDNLLQRIYTQSLDNENARYQENIVATLEEAQDWVNTTGKQIVSKTVAGHLRCEESVLQYLNPNLVAKAEANIARLRQLAPEVTYIVVPEFPK